MQASKVASALNILINNRQPIFLWGAPGVGKSQVIHETAAAMGREIVDIRAILLDPVDLRGLPKISGDGMAEWCAPSFLPRKGSGVLFLDELNAAPPLVQAACYQLVLDRKIGEYQLPEGWAVVAAGNRERDRAVTHRMPSALANRFVHIDFTVDSNEWLLWAEDRGLNMEIIEFIRFRPGLLHNFQPEKDSRAFPTPRSWEFASRLMNRKMPADLLAELLEGTVGKAATTEFLAFSRVRGQLPDIRRIFSEPMTVELPRDPAVLSATCQMVGRSVRPEYVEEVFNFAERLPDEFGVLLVREAVRNCRDLVNTEHFAGWSARNVHVLV